MGVTKGLRMRTEDSSSENYAQVTNTMASLAGVPVKDGVYFYFTQLASVSCSLEGKHEWSSTYFPIRLRGVFKDTFTLTLTSVLAQIHTPHRWWKNPSLGCNAVYTEKEGSASGYTASCWPSHSSPWESRVLQKCWRGCGYVFLRTFVFNKCTLGFRLAICQWVAMIPCRQVRVSVPVSSNDTM
jgi:hypothetical protein